MDPSQIGSFVVAASLLAAIPGPAMAYIAAQSLARGRRAGLMAAFGVHVGGWVHVLLMAAGLTAALRLVPDLYLGLRLAGAAYLVWLGIGIMRSSFAATPAPMAPLERRAFIDSVIVQILNPKVALLFLAFVPQFTDAAASLPIETQIVVLSVLLNVIFLVLDVGVALASGALGAAVRARRWIERGAGLVLLGLGARLALHRG